MRIIISENQLKLIVEQEAENADFDINNPNIVKMLVKMGYNPPPGGMSIENSINVLKNIVSKGSEIVQGKGVGQNYSAAKLTAVETAKKKAGGAVVPTNQEFNRKLDNGNIEVVVFFGKKPAI